MPAAKQAEQAVQEQKLAKGPLVGQEALTVIFTASSAAHVRVVGQPRSSNHPCLDSEQDMSHNARPRRPRGLDEEFLQASKHGQ